MSIKRIFLFITFLSFLLISCSNFNTKSITEYSFYYSCFSEEKQNHTSINCFYSSPETDSKLESSDCLPNCGSLSSYNDSISYTPSYNSNCSLELIKQANLGYSFFQDGCIYGNYLFAFLKDGTCYIFDAETFSLIDLTYLPSYNGMTPHSNSVSFAEKTNDDEEFPLLYSNIYNNYPSYLESYGVCCVYKISRDDRHFSFSLVQVIKVSFVDDYNLWYDNSDNESPFGNFVVCDNKLIVFVNLFGSLKTRFFVFELPEYVAGNGINYICLAIDDIVSIYDFPLFRYIQGCTYKDGFLFSLEGLGEQNSPGYLRIIDFYKPNLYTFPLFESIGESEPELICFYKDTMLIIDYFGNSFTFELIYK